jgi:hypothetical protein
LKALAKRLRAQRDRVKYWRSRVSISGIALDGVVHFIVAWPPAISKNEVFDVLVSNIHGAIVCKPSPLPGAFMPSMADMCALMGSGCGVRAITFRVMPRKRKAGLKIPVQRTSAPSMEPMPMAFPWP